MTQAQIRETWGNTARPRWTEFAVMGASAILLRAFLLLAAAAVYHKHFDNFAEVSDGHSYIAYARALCGEKNFLTDYDRRVFIGYSLVIAGVHLLGIPASVAAIALSWVAAGAACVMTAVLARSRRVGWAMVCLTPHFLLYSSVAMNEALLLACCAAGLLLAVTGLSYDLPRKDLRRWLYPLFGGLILGFAGLVRPFACFAVAGFLVHAYRSRQYRALLIVAVVAVAVVAAGFVGLQLVTGDALQGIKVYRNDPGAYHGELYTWPFKSLITRSIDHHVALAKKAYVWAYVVIDILAIVLLSRSFAHRWKQRRDRIDLFWVWLVGNTIAILCIGSIWGFEAFHRFSSWALPAELFALTPILPRRVWSWSVVAAASFEIALYSINRN